MDESSIQQSTTDARTDLASAGGYAFLAQRATAFVVDRGGAVFEDDLVAHVFGAGSSPDLWRPLIRSILGTTTDLILDGDGFWRISHGPSANEGDALFEFVAIDIETTGLRPLHQRIIEVAAIRYRSGAEVERFESLVQPDRRVPKYISELTGLTDAHLADAPRFAEIATDLQGFVGNAALVGHNLGFDVSFLNAELKRLGQPPLVNERLDVMYLAMKLLPGIRRPSLDKLATAVGLDPRRVHRAGGDAWLAAEAAIRLQEKARQQGDGAWDRLKVLAAPASRRPKDGVGRGRAVLDRSLLADIPKNPGVYIMRDAFEHVIYVGKAKNLRDRVSSYYSQPLGYTRKMDGLLETMVQIDVEVTGSELEALLLESQLIKRYQPRYNTALRSFEQYPYIRIDISNPWPRLTLARERKDDGARYFGPYRSKSAARKAVDLINANVPLRTCTRSFKDARSYGSPCIQLDIGRCPGPCVGRADRESYRAMIRDVGAFLDGDSDVLYARLWQGLEDAAQRLDFERARRLRNDLLQVEQVVEAQRRLRVAERGHTLLLVLPSADTQAREILIVVHSRLWSQIRARADDAEPALAKRLGEAWTRYRCAGISAVDYDSVDEANVLNRWLLRFSEHPAIRRIDEQAEDLDWDELASWALGLQDTQIDVDSWSDTALDEDEVVQVQPGPKTTLKPGNEPSENPSASSVAMPHDYLSPTDQTALAADGPSFQP
ncbi:MAG: exonuclease domain-containing protein [Thermomicrobiales bacterium]